jgi:hypothetical protein
VIAILFLAAAAAAAAAAALLLLLLGRAGESSPSEVSVSKIHMCHTLLDVPLCIDEGAHPEACTALMFVPPAFLPFSCGQTWFVANCCTIIVTPVTSIMMCDISSFRVWLIVNDHQKYMNIEVVIIIYCVSFIGRQVRR